MANVPVALAPPTPAMALTPSLSASGIATELKGTVEMLHTSTPEQSSQTRMKQVSGPAVARAV